MKEKFFQKKFIILYFIGAGLIWMGLVSVVYIESNVTYHNKILAQEGIICPSPTSKKNAMQLLNCYLNTPAPTIPVPTPTITPVVTKAPIPTPTVDPCSSQLADYAVVKQALLTKNKIDLQGDPDLAWANQTLTTMCKLSSSPTFNTLLTAQGNIVIRFHTGSCVIGNADMNTGIDLTGSCDPQLNRAVLVHELAHMIAFRNPAIFNSYLSTVWPSQIPTYNCQTHFGSGPTAAECFADGVAENVVYSYLRITSGGLPAGNPTFPEYPTTYASYYNLMNTSVFGSVSFTSF